MRETAENGGVKKQRYWQGRDSFTRLCPEHDVPRRARRHLVPSLPRSRVRRWRGQELGSVPEPLANLSSLLADNIAMGAVRGVWGVLDFLLLLTAAPCGDSRNTAPRELLLRLRDR